MIWFIMMWCMRIYPLYRWNHCGRKHVRKCNLAVFLSVTVSSSRASCQRKAYNSMIFPVLLYTCGGYKYEKRKLEWTNERTCWPTSSVTTQVVTVQGWPFCVPHHSLCHDSISSSPCIVIVLSLSTVNRGTHEPESWPRIKPFTTCSVSTVFGSISDEVCCMIMFAWP